MNLRKMNAVEKIDLRDKINWVNGYEHTAKITASGHLVINTKLGGILIPKDAEVDVIPPKLYKDMTPEEQDSMDEYRGSITFSWDDYIVCIYERFVGVSSKYFTFSDRG